MQDSVAMLDSCVASHLIYDQTTMHQQREGERERERERRREETYSNWLSLPLALVFNRSVYTLYYSYRIKINKTLPSSIIGQQKTAAVTMTGKEWKEWQKKKKKKKKKRNEERYNNESRREENYGKWHEHNK